MRPSQLHPRAGPAPAMKSGYVIHSTIVYIRLIQHLSSHLASSCPSACPFPLSSLSLSPHPCLPPTPARCTALWAAWLLQSAPVRLLASARTAAHDPVCKCGEAKSVRVVAWCCGQPPTSERTAAHGSAWECGEVWGISHKVAHHLPLLRGTAGILHCNILQLPISSATLPTCCQTK